MRNIRERRAPSSASVRRSAPRARMMAASALVLGARGASCICSDVESMHAEIGADNVRQQLPGQSLNVPIGLIHLPKTGGTAIEASDWACPDLRCYGHLTTARDWHLFGLKSLVILRDPVSRFVSAFEYARRGSDSAPISVQR